MRSTTTKGAANTLGVTNRRIRALIKAGKLKATKNGRDWIIEEREIEKIRNRPNGRPKQT